MRKGRGKKACDNILLIDFFVMSGAIMLLLRHGMAWHAAESEDMGSGRGLFNPSKFQGFHLTFGRVFKLGHFKFGFSGIPIVLFQVLQMGSVQYPWVLGSACR